MPQPNDPTPDPLDLDAVDQKIRINELQEQAKDLGMGDGFVSEDCPSEMHEQFLKNMIEYETAPVSSHFARLEKAGVALPAPDSLDEAALSAKLWEVINALAGMNTFLLHTNHMSDRQLYAYLWQDTLRECSPFLKPGSGWTCHLDLISSGSDESIEIGLRYYDTEEQRQHWKRDFPKMVIPPHEDPPFDRDRSLPAGKEVCPEWIGPDDEFDDEFEDDDSVGRADAEEDSDK